MKICRKRDDKDTGYYDCASNADGDDDYTEDDFIPCSRCDGHPACEDFGCAFELGLGKMVKESDL